MSDISGQTAVVTGGTRGIGAAISLALLRAGARVLATYNTNHDAAQAFATRCEEAGLGERLSLHAFDVADAAAVARFYEEIDGGLQILVNNSGFASPAPSP